MEYYSSTNNPASNKDEETWEENFVENGAALFRIEIKSPTSLEKRQARCEKLNQQLQNRVNNADGFWVLTSERSCETSMDDVVTLHVWLNRRSHQYVSVFCEVYIYCSRDTTHLYLHNKLLCIFFTL